MTRTRLFAAAVLAVVLGATVARTAPDVAPAPRPGVDLTGYKTVADATKADPKQFNATGTSNAAPAGFFGVVVGEKAGKPVVEAVAPESPADDAGVKEGDLVLKVGGQAATSAAMVRDALRAKLAGDRVTMTLSRSGKTVEVSATLKPATSPKTLAAAKAGLGVTTDGPGPNGGAKIGTVTTGGAGDKAGLKVADVITKMDTVTINSDNAFREFINNKAPGDRVELHVDRGDKKLELTAVLDSEDRPTGKGGFGGKGGGGFGGGGWDDRLPRAWRKPTYNLAIIGVEYPDIKHNTKIKDTDWEEELFSLGTYTGKSATGDKVYGSMNDYYRELSQGTFKIEGKFVGWVEMSKKRGEYDTGVGAGNEQKAKVAFLTEALDKYTGKAGKEALKDYDGVFILFAGEPPQGISRATLYWPHRSTVRYPAAKDGRLPYFIVSELRRGGAMMDISVFCHEFGHMLGLPDLYARPENPGSEGLWQWCAMSNQIGGGRPQHFSAWCKEQLGWVKPVVIDPRVKQKLVLAPIEDDPAQCYKVMVRPDGSEYFLLENRKKTGWDSQLPGEGLLVWRVTNGRPLLEESHGIEGARGPMSFPTLVPFPSTSNNSFTPYTMPSSKSQLGGGLPVWITNIRKLPDGRITFHIGYEFQ
jgi:M6 family metalloprotease-like protein